MNEAIDTVIFKKLDLNTDLDRYSKEIDTLFKFFKWDRVKIDNKIKELENQNSLLSSKDIIFNSIILLFKHR